MDESDQPLLNADDFVEGNEKLNENIKIDYCLQNAALCKILVSVIKNTSPVSLRRHTDSGSFSTIRASVDSRLAEWYLCLPTPLAKFAKSDGDLWSLQLQLHYNLALLQLHRIPDPSYTSVDVANDRTSRETSHTAALSITRVFDDILAQQSINQCWFTASTILLAAAIPISHEARLAAKARATVLAIQAQNQLERLLPILSAVSKYWSSAEAILNIYEGLLKQLKRQTQSSFVVQEQASGSYDIRSSLDNETSPGQRSSHFDSNNRLAGLECHRDD